MSSLDFRTLFFSFRLHGNFVLHVGGARDLHHSCFDCRLLVLCSYRPFERNGPAAHHYLDVVRVRRKIFLILNLFANFTREIAVTLILGLLVSRGGSPVLTIRFAVVGLLSKYGRGWSRDAQPCEQRRYTNISKKGPAPFLMWI